jgi:hypothetical protein
MTFATILPKLILMGILVAVGTGGKGDIPEMLVFLPICHIHLMAFYTINTGVFSEQGESCPGMIKFCSRFK